MIKKNHVFYFCFGKFSADDDVNKGKFSIFLEIFNCADVEKSQERSGGISRLLTSIREYRFAAPNKTTPLFLSDF